MINKIKKEIRLLRELKIISKSSQKSESRQVKTIISSLGIFYFIFFNYTFNIIHATGGDIPLIILITILLSAICAGVSYLFILLINYTYKLSESKKYSQGIKSEFKMFCDDYFISNKKLKKHINKFDKLTKSSKEMINKKYITQMSKETITEKVFENFINKEIKTEDITNNLSTYINEIEKLNLKNKKNYIHLLVKRAVYNLNYELFNKNKKEIINIIEVNFNDYEQQDYLKQMKIVKEKFDSALIKDNIIQYKKDLLEEKTEIKEPVKNHVLKSI